jgi:hypothetical protein
VDTNVAVVANGRNTDAEPACRIVCIETLEALCNSGRVVLDAGREMLKEYNRRLNQAGQPGVGDQFYRHLLVNQANKSRVRLVKLTAHAGRHFTDFPDDSALAKFHPKDRVFAAAARQSKAPVLNAVDSDWHHHAETLKRHGIAIHFLCGRERFKPPSGTSV